MKKVADSQQTKIKELHYQNSLYWVQDAGIEQLPADFSKYQSGKTPGNPISIRQQSQTNPYFSSGNRNNSIIQIKSNNTLLGMEDQYNPNYCDSSLYIPSSSDNNGRQASESNHTMNEKVGQQTQEQQESKFVSPSEEPHKFAEFGKFLEFNFAGANSKNLCVQCWCLCNRYQMSKHKELNHRLLTPKYFKDQEAFINLANQCGRFKDVSSFIHGEGGSSTQRVYEIITAHTDFLHSTSAVLTQCAAAVASKNQEQSLYSNQSLLPPAYEYQPNESPPSNPEIVFTESSYRNQSSAHNPVSFSNNDFQSFFKPSEKQSMQSSIISLMPNTFSEIELPMPNLSSSSNEFFGSTSVSASDMRIEEPSSSGAQQITIGQMYRQVQLNFQKHQDMLDQIHSQYEELKNICLEIRHSTQTLINQFQQVSHPIVKKEVAAGDTSMFGHAYSHF